MALAAGVFVEEGMTVRLFPEQQREEVSASLDDMERGQRSVGDGRVEFFAVLLYRR